MSERRESYTVDRQQGILALFDEILSEATEDSYRCRQWEQRWRGQLGALLARPEPLALTKRGRPAFGCVGDEHAWVPAVGKGDDCCCGAEMFRGFEPSDASHD